MRICTCTCTSIKSFLVSSVICFSLALNPALEAAENKEKQSKYKTRKAVAMSQKVYKKLQKTQELIDEKKYSEGLAVLKKLRTKKRLSAYERAQSWNVTAYIYYLQENYAPAINAYKKVLEQGELPDALAQSTLKTVSQLYFMEEEYQQALGTIQQLIEIVESPSVDIYILLGQAYFQLKQYDKALPEIQKAISNYRSLGKVPKENWLLLVRVIHHQKNDYKKLRLSLEELISLYPKDRYMRALAGVYSELGDTQKQLTMMEALYERDYKQTSGQILNLANLYFLHGVPYKAAKILHEGIEQSKRVKPTESNYRLLSQAWYQAREDEKSISPMRKAAVQSKTGELYVRIAQSYMNLDRWQEAATALRSGLKKGGLKRHDTAQLMLGMTLFNQKNLKQASKHFELAHKDERSEKVAKQWIAYVQEEMKRQELAETGKLKPEKPG